MAVTLVVDPSLSAEQQDLLKRKILQPERIVKEPSRNASSASGGLIIVAVVAGLAVILLHGFNGVSLWWVAVSAIPLLAGILTLAPSLNRESNKLDSRDLTRCVRPSDLDIPSYLLLQRAQNAIQAILESDAYGRSMSNHPVGESGLRRHEWEIATALKDISRLSREIERSTGSGSAGPMTTTVLDAQRQALALAKDGTTSRISALERYASELEMADRAKLDWQTALKASGLNDQYLDLVARTAADEHAISEIQGLTEQAAAAAEGFREHLHQADLAAEALILPDTPTDL